MLGARVVTYDVSMTGVFLIIVCVVLYVCFTIHMYDVNTISASL